MKRERGSRAATAAGLCALVGVPVLAVGAGDGPGGSDAPPAARPAERTSLRSLRASQEVETFEVDSVPRISLGSPGIPAQQFLWVRDATLLDDGRVAVLDGASSEIRVFSGSRDTGVILGGEGDGPGEYRSLQGVRQLPSSDLRVFDLGRGRLTTVSLDGTVVSTVSLLGELTSVPLEIGRPFASGAVPYTQIARGMRDRARRPDGLLHDDLRVAAFTEGGPATVTVVPGLERFSVRDGGRGLTKPVPLSPEPLVAFGTSVVVVGSTHSTRFHVLSEDGSPLEELVAVGELEEPSARDWSLFEEAFLAENQAPPRIGGVPLPAGEYRLPEELLARAPRSRFKPLFDRAVLRGDRELWLREFDLRSARSTWQVVRPDGVRALAVMPRAWEVLEVGLSHVLVLVEDELGVESVRVYGLRR